MIRLILLPFFILMTASWPASAQTSADQAISSVKFEQKIGNTLPLNTTFHQANGQAVRLGNFFGNKPVVLALVYLDCPNLCDLVINGLVESVRRLKEVAGQDYDILLVSVRPYEPYDQLLEAKERLIRQYGRAGSEGGWHFLTGSQAAVDSLAQAAGYQYEYDPDTDQYAHPSGIVVCTPEGRVAQYLFGIEYSAQALHDALGKAAEEQLGSPVHQLLLLCFSYDPNTGQYTPIITRFLQLGSALTLAALAGIIVIAQRARRKS